VIRLIGFLLVAFVIVLVVRSLRRRAPERTSMSRAEALEALGVPEGASDEEVVKAYRKLMTRVHPDTPGGSTYLATKLNQAKDVLLG
jgi:preprotein translocase subunit Sec63